MGFRQPHIAYREGDEIQASNLRKAEVEAYAGRVAATFDFGIGAHPSTLVEKLGGKIHYQEMDAWLAEAGSIFVHGKWNFDILLPLYTSPVRDRFTIAHELGHYFLHAGQGAVPIIAYRQGSTRIEWEANWFAAGLLMPAAAFREAWGRSPGLSVIAVQFGVSEEAARVRMVALRICLVLETAPVPERGPKMVVRSLRERTEGETSFKPSEAKLHR
jgi:hypothetical protein